MNVSNADANGRSASTSHAAHYYPGLDMLRGVAAIGIVWYHFSARLNLPYLFPHGYLAVDFFFALSGFVIANAYMERILVGKLQIYMFYTLRLVRFLPLVFLGTMLAAAMEIYRPGIEDRHQHLTNVINALIAGSLLIPILYQSSLEHSVFPLNGPVWSLLFELFANFIFATFVKSSNIQFMFIFSMISSGIAIIVGCRMFGHVDFGSHPDNFWLGFPRVIWSFLVGIALYKYRSMAPRVPLSIIAIILVLIFLIPNLGSWKSEIFDALCVLVVLPYLVFAASTAQLDNFGEKFSIWSGNLSFPIYAIHYPLVRATSFALMKFGLSDLEKILSVLAFTIILIFSSYLVHNVYDVPVRRRILDNIRKRAPSNY